MAQSKDINQNALLEFAKTLDAGSASEGNSKVARVTRVDGNGTAYVLFPNNSEETPIAMTGVELSVGDIVNVILSDGKLRVIGNVSQPSISKAILKKATDPIVKAAAVAKKVADEAAAVANATNQHFWTDDNGAHVTDITHDAWEDAAADGFSDLSDLKPYPNLLLNSLGFLLRSALNNLVSITRSAIAFYDGQGNNAGNILAQFGSNGAQIGKLSAAHSIIDADGQRFYATNGTTQLVNFGYGEGNADSGTANAPYYTLGTRASTPPSYSSGVVYKRGNLCTHDGTPYVCTYDMASAEAWNADHWSSTLVGNLSLAEGRGNAAIGHGSHAEGNGTSAFGLYSHSEGIGSVASGDYSHVEGYQTRASGMYSHAQGVGTIAASSDQTVVGKYNVEDTNDTYAFIVGNGTSSLSNWRSNAFTVGWDGTIVLANDSTLWDNSSGNTHLLTPESGKTAQAEYSFEAGGLYIRKRTRTSSTAAWGSWSGWTLIS